MTSFLCTQYTVYYVHMYTVIGNIKMLPMTVYSIMEEDEEEEEKKKRYEKATTSFI